MRIRTGGLLILAALLSGALLGLHCTPTGIGTNDPAVDGGERPPIEGLTAIAVTPARASLTVDNLNPSKTQAYQATGTFSNGEQRDISSQVNWSLDNAAIGSVNPVGLFSTSNKAGGTGNIVAKSGNIMGSAIIEVVFVPSIKASDAPTNADMLIPPTMTGSYVAGMSPTVVYPSDQTLFARNMYRVLFQWNQGTGNDLFRLEFKSPTLTMSVYTSSDRWQPDAQQWGFIADSNAGGSVTWTIYGTKKASPTTIYSSTPVTLNFSKNPVEGAIYYWSTTVAGVRRATVSDAAPTDFYTPAQVGKCVACHTVSRNGTRLAADIGGDTLGVIDVKDRTAIIPSTSNIPASWTTFNPDTTRIVTASKGILTLRNGATGAAINTVPVGMGKFGTQPDWSPDGKLLTFALSATNKDRGIQGSSIATIEYVNDTWQNLKIISPSAASSDSRYYPMFSPDSKWIAFAKATGSSDNNDTARLWIVPADGSTAAIELTRANYIVSNATLTGNAADIGNTMPTWAPTKPGELMFLAFSSARAYGKVYATGKYEQLWVTAINPAQLPAKDASYPAFRLPFQDLTENSHRPFWAEDVLAPPTTPPDGGAGGMCLPANSDCISGQCCGGLRCTPDANNVVYTCQIVIG